MSPLVALLSIDAALLALSVAAVALASLGKPGSRFIYSASFVFAAAAFVVALSFLLGRDQPMSASLPIGLPWIGAHFRLDALSAFFVALIESRRRGGELLRDRLWRA